MVMKSKRWGFIYLLHIGIGKKRTKEAIFVSLKNRVSPPRITASAGTKLVGSYSQLNVIILS